MTCGCPRPDPCRGSVTPANNGSFDVGVVQIPPFGIHHVLSPVFRLYAVTPPNSFGLRIDTPPIVDVPGAALAGSKGAAGAGAAPPPPPRPPPPPPRPPRPPLGGTYPGGGGIAP